MELYFKPTFYNALYPAITTGSLAINEEYQDLYTEIKKHTSENISSKFRQIRYIPLSGGDLDYESDWWDFSQYSLITNPHATIVFTDCCDVFKNDLKDYILLVLLSGNMKISSLYGESMQTRIFLNYLAKNGLQDITGIDDSDVAKFLNSLTVAETTFIKYQASIKKFLSLYDAEHGTELLSPGINKLCQRMDFCKLRSIRIANRRKAIPKEYLNTLISLLIKTMNDKNYDDLDRGLAAMLVIDSQTGLRASELSLLEADSVETIDIDGEKAMMIHYKIIKTAKGNTGIINEITYINDVSYQAYKVLCELFKDNRKRRNSNLLFCPRHAGLPARSDTYVNFLKRFCVINTDILDSTNKNLTETLDGKITKGTLLSHFYKGKGHRRPEIETYSLDQEFYYPLVHQFRNTVVAELLGKGIQLEFIRRYMGHLTEEMTAAYAESYDTKMQENLSVSEETINQIITGEAKLLGSNAKKLTEGIDEWIHSNNLNIATDIDEIIAGLEKLIPIRAKRGGVCIKGAKITNACSVDTKTDEFLCAVGLCPNICHFYFNAAESYIDYKEALSTYNYNQENGFDRQAKKELTKANFILANRLSPEIIELENEINNHGLDAVIRRHPELLDVISNLDEIKEAIYEYTERQSE